MRKECARLAIENSEGSSTPPTASTQKSSSTPKASARLVTFKIITE